MSKVPPSTSYIQRQREAHRDRDREKEEIDIKVVCGMVGRKKTEKK